MKTIFRTVRTAALLLIGVGLLANGAWGGSLPCSMEAATHKPAACCNAGKADSNACCSHICCRTQAPRPDQTTSDQTRPHVDRTAGKAGWVGLALLHGSVGSRFERHGFGPEIPTSGSPSLITQHVRLQT